jgi:chemotaxis protein CheD
MSKIINVDTGQLKVGGSDSILRSSAIGSCIAIAVYNSKKPVGILAHIMLPGKSPLTNSVQKNKYAENAIDEIIETMNRLGVKNNEFEVCLVGAANVLEDKADTICVSNIKSVVDLLKEKNIKINVKALGGVQRRTISFDVGKGRVFFSEGNGIEKLLWSAIADGTQAR